MSLLLFLLASIHHTWSQSLSKRIMTGYPVTQPGSIWTQSWSRPSEGRGSWRRSPPQHKHQDRLRIPSTFHCVPAIGHLGILRPGLQHGLEARLDEGEQISWNLKPKPRDMGSLWNRLELYEDGLIRWGILPLICLWIITNPINPILLCVLAISIIIVKWPFVALSSFSSYPLSHHNSFPLLFFFWFSHCWIESVHQSWTQTIPLTTFSGKQKTQRWMI